MVGKTLRHPDLKPGHPGALLRNVVLPALPQSKAEIARLLGVSRQTLYGILDEKRALTPEMAVRIGKLCGNGPGFWLRMQQVYDLWHAERDVDISRIPTLTEVS